MADTLEEYWGQARFADVWQNFAGNDYGIVFSVWDPSRVRWLVDPQQPDSPAKSLLFGGKIQKWGYFPIDASGPENRLCGILADTISRYDRVLTYGLWAKDLVERSIGREVDWMPHGIDMSVFTPRDKVGARMAIGFQPQDRVIGMVATNQARKDFGTAFAAFATLAKQDRSLRLWIHIDDQIRHWHIPALLSDYGVGGLVKVSETGTVNDERLSWFYSGCDVTILPSSEGFGYPLVESLACGTPVIHSSYGGGAELVANTENLVVPVTYRLESIWNSLRPVWSPEDWVDAIKEVLAKEWNREELRRGIQHLGWDNLVHPWRKWLLRGIGL
jgi:glycosyltransferase involved in cell wall biosynthesis